MIGKKGETIQRQYGRYIRTELGLEAMLQLGKGLFFHFGKSPVSVYKSEGISRSDLKRDPFLDVLGPKIKVNEPFS